MRPATIYPVYFMQNAVAEASSVSLTHPRTMSAYITVTQWNNTHTCTHTHTHTSAHTHTLTHTVIYTHLVYDNFKPMKKCVPFIFKSKSSPKSRAQVQVKSRVITWQVTSKSQANKSATRIRLESSCTDSSLQLW